MAAKGKYHYCLGEGDIMAAGKWLEISGKWYHFHAGGPLAKNIKVDGCKADKNGVRKSK